MTRRNGADLKDVWQTPDELRTLLPNIDLDPCASDETDIGETNWTERGMQRDWFGTVYVNPPFSAKEEWLSYAVSQSQRDAVDTILFVTPDSTDTKSWWHTYIAPHATYVWFSEGRISYINPETGETGSGATFGTAISMFGNPSDSTIQQFAQHGHLVQTVYPTDI